MLSGLWNLFIRALGTAVALWVVTLLIDGVSIATPDVILAGDGSYDRLLVFLGVAAVIVVLNMLVRPVLQVIGLPITLITLGLFALVINAAIFLLAEWISQALGLGLSIETFLDAFWGAIIMAIVNWLLGPLTGLLSSKR
ncbi:phage holin family protein [Corynebacterium halotolerans]|uniref:phage holin family protein n=1 Tax=Corynebacterium halotolerans TaxID=225326 RepID=UPI003CEE6519